MIDVYKNYGDIGDSMVYGSNDSIYGNLRELDIAFSGIDPNEFSECIKRDTLRYSRDISLDEEGVRL